MLRLLALFAVVVATGFLLWPDDAKERPDSPASAPAVQAALAPETSGPLARGIKRARAVITVRRGSREYELRGGLDLSEGYRFRGRITKSSDRYMATGTPIWLAGGRGSWGGADRPETLTKPDFSFRREPVWFDDHAPTLPLTRSRPLAYDPNSREGAEVYAHLSLLAIKHARYGHTIDFAPYANRNDLTSVSTDAGRTDFDATVGATGTLQRLRIDLPPASVDVHLFPSDRSIPALKLRGFAME